MGIRDRLRGVKRPQEGTAPVSRPELERRLMALNHDQVPFRVKAGEQADLEAEWKIVDAEWYEIFAKAGLEKTHRLYLQLDEEQHAVLALEEHWEVSWRAGVPKMQVSAEKFRGRTMGAKEFGRAYAFTGIDPLRFGEAYNYRFDVSEMKRPIIEVITQGGWAFVPVTTKRSLGG